MPAQCLLPLYKLLYQITWFIAEQPQMSGIALTISLLDQLFYHRIVLLQCISLQSFSFLKPRRHAELLCFALCAHLIFTWQRCKFSTGGLSLSLSLSRTHTEATSWLGSWMGCPSDVGLSTDGTRIWNLSRMLTMTCFFFTKETVGGSTFPLTYHNQCQQMGHPVLGVIQAS